MKDWLVFAFNALENIALAICISIVAIRFNRPGLLWFYVLIPLNGVYTSGKDDENEK